MTGAVEHSEHPKRQWHAMSIAPRQQKLIGFLQAQILWLINQPAPRCKAQRHDPASPPMWIREGWIQLDHLAQRGIFVEDLLKINQIGRQPLKKLNNRLDPAIRERSQQASKHRILLKYP